LQSQERSLVAEGHEASSRKHAPVLPQYLAVALGVVVEPLLRHYVATNSWDVEWASLAGRTVFGLIVGIIILPGVYKASFDPEKPLLIQLAALFPIGIGWQSLFTSATKITLG